MGKRPKSSPIISLDSAKRTIDHDENVKPNPQHYGFVNELNVLHFFQEFVRYHLDRGVTPVWADLPDSLRRYNEALLAWHERTGVPYETDAEYRAKITKGGQS